MSMEEREHLNKLAGDMDITDLVKWMSDDRKTGLNLHFRYGC